MGIRGPIPLPRKVWPRIKYDPSGCWLWQGQIATHGYGVLSHSCKQLYAHRVVYEMVRGPIPEGLELDHLCRVRHCVSPWHLEAVTHSENVKRGLSTVQMTERHANRTHCKQGHEFTPENTKPYFSHGVWSRVCKACERAKYVRKRSTPPKTHGVTGSQSGCKCEVCRKASRDAARERYQRKKFAS